MKEAPIFTNLGETNFEKIFEIQATASQITAVKCFEPELRGDSIILPIEITNTNGETVTLGFTLDREHLRDLLDVSEFPDTIE